MSLLVTSQINNTVREYDSTTGAFLKVAASGGALGDPLDVVVGLDGNLLVSDGQTNQVKRYNRATGAFIDVFASTNLAGPMGMTIHDGVLYVTNSNPPQGVQSFDAATGAKHGRLRTLARQPQPPGREGQPREQASLRALLQCRHRRDVRSRDQGFARPPHASW